MTQLDPQAKLYEKLFKARKAAEAVTKGGDGEGFKFARFEDVLEEASSLLDKHRILIVPRVVDHELKFSRTRPFAVAMVQMEFEVIDTKDCGSITLTWSGSADDQPGGKALFKAQTGCEKYFLAKLLRIPFGTDPEEVGDPATSPQSSTELVIPPDDDAADQVRVAQDRAAEEPQVPRHEKPLPQSDLPTPDWDGLARSSEVPANA